MFNDPVAKSQMQLHVIVDNGEQDGKR